MEGYIKLHRKLLQWEWYTDTNVRVLFFHILLKANYKPVTWHGLEIDAGQLVTSYDHLAKECNMTIQQVRTALNKLKITGEITHQTTSQNSIITVNNWKQYQTKQQAKQQQNNNNIRNKEREKDINLSLSRIGKREREILKNYCKRKKIDNSNAYIRKLIDNGDAKVILEEEEIRQKKLEQREKPVQVIDKSESPEEVQEAFLKAKSKVVQIRRGNYGNAERDSFK